MSNSLETDDEYSIIELHRSSHNPFEFAIVSLTINCSFRECKVTNKK